MNGDLPVMQKFRVKLKSALDYISMKWVLYKFLLCERVGNQKASDQLTYNTYKKMISQKESLAQKLPCRENINDAYYNLPLEPRKILMVGLGKNVRGNLQVLLNELNSSEDYEGFQIYVRTSDETDENVRSFIEENGWSRTKTVLDDREYSVLLETSKYLLTEVYFPDSWAKRPGQVLISIWHGTPIKKIGLSKNSDTCHKNGPAQKNFINADYLLYPNTFTKDIMLDSYKVTQLMKGHFMMMGYPRTGGMLSMTKNEKLRLRSKLAPEGKRLYVYMPTFRDYLSEEEGVIMIKELLDYLEESLAEDQILYVNLHHKFNGVLSYDGYTKILPFPPDVDSYQILAVSDALISDYSSVFFDYLALRKQIVLYIPDYEIYRRRRGVYFDLISLPFDMAESKEAVLEALKRGKQYDDTEIYEDLCCYDSPDNAKKLCRLFLGDTSFSAFEPVPRNGAPNVLIHTELAPKGEKTKILESLANTYGEEKYNLFFTCSKSELNPKESGAYPMFRQVPVIGSDSEHRFSSVGRTVKDLYLQGKLTFEEAVPCLELDYRLMSKRMVGESEVSVAVIYDCVDADRILALASMDAHLLLFLHKEMLDAIQAGDTYLKDAVCYTAKKSRGVYTFSDQECTQAQTLFGKRQGVHISKIRSAGELNDLIEKAISG